MDITSSQRKAIARWARPTDHILITELLGHFRSAGRVSNKYSLEIWVQVTAQVNKPSVGTGVATLSVLQVKNRYFSLKKNWKDFMCLLETDGFVWDKERGKINAEKDAWAKYLKAHPRAGVFRQRPLDNFEELSELFGGPEQTISATVAQADEDADDEAEDQMDEDEDHPAENAEASQSIYQASPIPNDNGARASDFNLPALPAPTSAWVSSSVGSASPGSEGSDGYSTAGSRCPKHDHDGSDLTEIAKNLTAKMDELITTIKSQGMKEEQAPAQYFPYAEAVRKAVKLYHSGEISKTDFRLIVTSLKQDPLECVAFWQMSDELRIDWIIEKAKEGEKRTPS